MAQGLSIHIGLNNVDPSRYNGWSGQLSGCVNDATDMQRIAQSLGYRSTLYTNGQATCATVLGAIGRASQQLQSGDILLLTYSGHGGQVNDVNGDESDGQDETWVLYDRMLVDDELGRCWSSFRDGVRIFVLSDSCHSGTVLRMLIAQQAASAQADANADAGTSGDGDGTLGGVQAARSRAIPRIRSIQEVLADSSQPRTKNIDPAVEQVIRTRDADLYATVQWLSNDTREARDAIRPAVVLISGCQDNQVSLDGARNGLFTEKLLSVWNSGGFQGDYRAFHQAILGLMPSTQTPNLDTTGTGVDAFLRQRPFCINAGSVTVVSSATPAAVIAGPSSATRDGDAPVFQVNPGAGRYYAVEVATRAELFNSQLSGSSRSADNFFATWTTVPLLSSSSYPSAFTLPDDVWQRLGASASRLYYRLWSSSAPSTWSNYATSTPDGEAVRAPSLEIVEATSDVETPAQPVTGPTIVGPSSIPLTASSVRFQVNPGPGRFYCVEVATRADLLNLDNASQRSSSNFYGSWSMVPFPRAASYPASYDLPATVWQRLRQAGNALYYRLWATDSPNAWVNQQASTADSAAGSAPCVRISREAGVEEGAGVGSEEPAMAGA